MSDGKIIYKTSPTETDRVEVVVLNGVRFRRADLPPEGAARVQLLYDGHVSRRWVVSSGLAHGDDLEVRVGWFVSTEEGGET
jgi:hypothetical protein